MLAGIVMPRAPGTVCTSAAWMIMRCVAVNFGWHVVIVISASVGAWPG